MGVVGTYILVGRLSNVECDVGCLVRGKSKRVRGVHRVSGN